MGSLAGPVDGGCYTQLMCDLRTAGVDSRAGQQQPGGTAETSVRVAHRSPSANKASLACWEWMKQQLHSVLQRESIHPDVL